MTGSKLSPSYADLLQTPQWRHKRQQILARDEHRCRNCGATADLQVHHRQYHWLRHPGEFVAPWCYPAHLLITLCASCHRNGHASFRVPVFAI
ncbi:hypothetical protein FDY95_22080 [Hymenobacter jeollabukensis]|uniref:HNH endonuclease n=1 Tax=Hymenobacter jeollabukensis TaxID=2025313 RepID=A0A5R8WK22_9BACT|nr:hypothetical protein FDY95_22080 [Hymenobacter jeollabukensis]